MNACVHTWPHMHFAPSTSGYCFRCRACITGKKKNTQTQDKQWAVTCYSGRRGWVSVIGTNRYEVVQLCLGHWVIVNPPTIFPDGQPLLWLSLLTIQGWMLGIVGFSPVCGVLLEHSQMKSDAVRPSQQTTLTWLARGGECQWELPPTPLWLCSLDHLTKTLQHDNAVQYNSDLRDQKCAWVQRAVDDLQEGSAI